MRVQGVVILLAAFGAAEAQASSIVTLPPLAEAARSIIALGEEAAVDPSIVAAVFETGQSPSIVAVPDTPDTPSIITLGGPAPAGEATASSGPQPSPTVIRGGEAGQAFARPSPAPAAQSGPPLLDPNDRGTPAKRNALKRQAERLAREAEAAGQSQRPDPSTEPVPLGE